jgi:hypothetical protein
VGAWDAPASWRYLRFREPPYDDATIRAAAARIASLLAAGVEVFAFFRHEDAPTAPAYAGRLRELIGEAL